MSTPILSAGFVRLIPRSQLYVGLVVILAVVVPAIWFGPWLPFKDLVAFVALDSYPAQMTYGPVHFEPLQFTYILHLVISRIFTGLGLTVPSQILIFYLVQGIVFVVVLWRTAQMVLPEGVLLNCALAYGALAFWEGQFIWGGPLPFSLAACLTSIGGLIVITESVRTVPNGTTILLGLLVLGVVSHPFVLPLASLILAVRVAFVPERRWATVFVFVMAVGFTILVARDSPRDDVNAEQFMRALLSFDNQQIAIRFKAMFTEEMAVLKYLFDEAPVLLTGYCMSTGLIKLVGFMVSPLVLTSASSPRPIRVLAALDLMVGLVYFLAPSMEAVLPNLPQRILAFYGPFVFAAGVAGPIFLARRWLASRGAVFMMGRHLSWSIPTLLVAFVFTMQVPVLRRGDEIRRNFEQVRREVLESNLTNAFVVVCGLQDVQPRFLHCVPFLLFSDRQIIDRHLVIHTEWHIQSRHPTRLTERWFDLGRKQCEAKFHGDQTGLHVQLRVLSSGEFAVPVDNYANKNPEIGLLEATKGDVLLREGFFRDAITHYQASLRLRPDNSAAHSNLGVALVNTGRLQEGVEHFREAVRLSPNFVGARTNLGQMLLRTGQRAEALAEFEAALRLEPTNPAAKEGVRLAAPVQ